MKYAKIYNKLCARGRTKRELNPEQGRKERHHIIPVHFGGEFFEDNITVLTHKEHILAHHILYRLYGFLEDKLAYRMMKGVIRNVWEETQYKDTMKEIVTQNLEKVDRKKQAEASRQAGLRMKENKIGIHADGMLEKSIEASKQWAKLHPDLASKRSALSHKNRTQLDYIQMANKKSKHYIISPEGTVYNSIAEAAYYTGLSRTVIENRARKGTYNWTRKPITGRE